MQWNSYIPARQREQSAYPQRIPVTLRITVTRHVTVTVAQHCATKTKQPRRSHAKTIVRGTPASPAPHYITIATTQARPPRSLLELPSHRNLVMLSTRAPHSGRGPRHRIYVFVRAFLWEGPAAGVAGAAGDAVQCLGG